MFSHNSKQHIVRAMELAGIFSLVRQWNKPRLRAALYHRFSEYKNAGFVSRATFAEQIRYARKTFRIVHPDKLFHEGSKWDDAMVITVDDGYRDFYDVAYPILRESSVPAIVYLTTDFVDGKSWLWFDKVDFLTRAAGGRRFHFPPLDVGKKFDRNDTPRILRKLKTVGTQERDAQIVKLSEDLGIPIPASPPNDYLPLSWEQIREMAANGIAFGSHTCAHPILTQSETGEAKSEILGSKQRIQQELGKPVTSFAYPNGDYSTSVKQMIAESGYGYSFSCDYGFISSHDDRYTLSRIPIGDRPLIYFRQEMSGVDILKHRVRGFFRSAKRR